LWDSSRPARFAVLEELRKRTLLVPRAALPGAAQHLSTRRWAARALPRRTLVVDLLRRHADTLARSPAVDAEGAALAARVVADLVDACVALAGDAPRPVEPMPPPSVAALSAVRRHAVLQAVHATIDRRLDRVESDGVPLRPDDLAPRVLAAAHAMSVRSLHQLQETQGETLSARVRRLRLEAARRQLEGGQVGTIAAVAARWGFADAAHFTRAYKDLFGERPSDTVERGLRGGSG
jgi:AraC-like DNA-binding protein